MLFISESSVLGAMPGIQQGSGYYFLKEWRSRDTGKRESKKIP